MTKQLTVPSIIAKRHNNDPITALAVYDYTFAKLADAAGVDILLVGDSLGTLIQGHSNTLPVTLEDMIYHCRAVVRGTKQALVVADMPFMSYQLGAKEALASAGRLIKESGVSAVKLEGGSEIAETIRRITLAGIPVMGHIGLQPQSVHQAGGYRVKGRKEDEAAQLLSDASAIEEAGAFSLVLEAIPPELAGRITSSISIPSIGIGAGPSCSGQILVMHDLLGLTHLEPEAYPRFVRNYASLAQEAVQAIENFKEEVRQGKFPAAEHCYKN